MTNGASSIPAIPDMARWRERAVYLLLFLFPLFGVSLDHWFGAIYALIFLLSLTCVFGKSESRLYLEERLLLYFMVIYFASFILSALANEWTEVQTRYLGVEIRYLAIIPVYLMLRSYRDAGYWLLMGCMVASLTIAAQAYCDVYALNKLRASGAYSPNLIGPFAALIAAWILVVWKFHCSRGWVLILLLVAAIFAVALSGSRGAYIGLIVMTLMIVIFTLSRWQRYAATALVVVGLLGIYGAVDEVKTRVNLAASEVGAYFSDDQDGNFEQPLSGTAVRFEMWYLSGKIFLNNPVFGIGRGNYVDAASRYVEAGDIHPDAEDHAHPHNAYIEMLVSRGAVGLCVFLLMIICPLYYFYSTRKQAPYTALLGIVHIVGFMVFSLTDASTFLKGNFVSIFLLFLVSFFSSHVKKVRGIEKVGRSFS